MAKQRIHNSRAGRGGGGASWISYSDMMAALLLIFVLILSYSLYEYFTMMESKTAELEAQQLVVSQQQITLDKQTAELLAQQQLTAQQQTELDKQTAALSAAQLTLDQQTAALLAQQAELDKANAALISREDELAALQGELASKQTALDAATEVLNAQKQALASQAAKIDDIVGMRTKIVQDLSSTLTSRNMRVKVDEQTGDIVLDSAVFFDFNSSTLSAEGKSILDKFLPAYLGVLLQPEYSDYLGEIIIEGHTDTVGTRETNMTLSHKRAMTVLEYCLTMPTLTSSQRRMLENILTPVGKGFTNPVYNADGTVNQDASRRVEFKFSLKDAEMITELNKILQGT